MWGRDKDKRQANLAKHGVDFALMDDFDWLSSDIQVDDRFDYGEVREAAIGLIGDRLFAVAFTRRGKVTRIISLRKANEREKRQWSTSAR